MHARERAIGKERMKGGDPALVDIREISAEPRANRTVVALPRHVDEDRDEAVEAVAPHEYPHARTLFELQNRQGVAVEKILVDLKQLVARIRFEHVQERLAGMAF